LGGSNIIILRKKELILVGVIYYIPDYTNLLNEFYWQCEDIVPDMPRVHKFLNFWKDNIEAVIKEVQVSLDGKNKYTHTDFLKELN